MDFFKSVLTTVVGESDSPTTLSGAEAIEKLLDRVQTSTLLDDRRDACRALKSLSKEYRLEVGAQGLGTLIGVLVNDRHDNEIISYVLDSLCNVISGSNEDPFENPVVSEEKTTDLGIQFTEIFAKDKENIGILLELLSESDFKVRYPALKLLMGMLRHRLKDIQELVLACPTGVSRLMDLLSDSREIIRNDAILVLVLLTRGNSNIQKIVAFENAFDRLFEIISSEGYTDGGVVVEDCLLVLQNLLKNNVSNQNFFKEGNFVQKLIPFLKIISTDEPNWDQQRASHILFFLQVVRTLVSPTNSSQAISSAQNIISKCGLLKKLCDLLMCSGIPAGLLAESINTIAEVIRGDHHNQEYFSSLMAPTVPEKPVLVVLLMSMVNEKQPFELRTAVLYCFQCFLRKNDLGQAKVIETLLPNAPVEDESAVTSGPLLCGGLFSSDSITNWLTCVALMHTLVENKTQKEQLLRVQLATERSQPIALMSQVCSMIQHQGIKFQKKMGLLMLISTWLSHCPLAVAHFLNIPTNIPLLTSQVGIIESDEVEILCQGLCAFILGLCIIFNDDSVPSFTKNDLRQLIVKRAGLEIFTNKLSSVCKSHHYSIAAQKPQLKYMKPEDLVYDFEFCNLFKQLEHVIINAVKEDESSNSIDDIATGPHSQYRDLIRKQDEELQTLRPLLTERERLKEQMDERNAYIKQLNDQIALLKGQNIANSMYPSDYSSESERLKAIIDARDGYIQQLHEQIGYLKSQRTVDLSLETEVNNLRRENEYLRAENHQLREQHHQLIASSEQSLLSIQQLKDELSRFKTQKNEQYPDGMSVAEQGLAGPGQKVTQLESENVALTQQLMSVTQDLERIFIHLTPLGQRENSQASQ